MSVGGLADSLHNWLLHHNRLLYNYFLDWLLDWFLDNRCRLLLGSLLSINLSKGSTMARVNTAVAGAETTNSNCSSRCGGPCKVDMASWLSPEKLQEPCVCSIRCTE